MKGREQHGGARNEHIDLARFSRELRVLCQGNVQHPVYPEDRERRPGKVIRSMLWVLALLKEVFWSLGAGRRVIMHLKDRKGGEISPTGPHVFL